jgi:hypothetical protein
MSKLCVGLALSSALGASACSDTTEDPGWTTGSTGEVTSTSNGDTQSDDAGTGDSSGQNSDGSDDTSGSDTSGGDSSGGTTTGVDPSNHPPSQDPPGGLDPANVPMFVSLGWDDNAYSGLEGTPGGMDWARAIHDARTNPDGSPATSSFYFTSVYIGAWQAESPTFVKRSWREAMDNGHEVGVHTHSHSHGGMVAQAEWDTEIETCLDWLTKPYDPNEPDTSPDDTKGIGASMDEIPGFRTPYLEYNDNLLASVAAHGFRYDCSIEEGWQPDHDAGSFNWPYTLDGGSPGHDVLVEWGSKEPINPHPGLWELPAYPVVVPPDEVAADYGIPVGLRDKLKSVQSWFDTGSGKITGFDYNLWVSFNMTKDEVVATLKYTLDQRLEGNRAPFLFGTHSDYYSDKYTAPMASTAAERREAMEEFLDYALTKPEVRVKSAAEVLDWIQSPAPL